MGRLLWAAIFFAANSWAQTYPAKSAIIGTQFVKAAPPDGYTLLSVAVTFAPAADFTGVSLVCRIPQLLVVNANHPARSVQDLVAIAKAKPGEVSFGSSGNGSTGRNGLVAPAGTPREKSEAEAFARLVREAGIKVE